MVKEQVRLSTMEEEVLRVNADKFNLRGHGERMDPGGTPLNWGTGRATLINKLKCVYYTVIICVFFCS